MRSELYGSQKRQVPRSGGEEKEGCDKKNKGYIIIREKKAETQKELN